MKVTAFASEKQVQGTPLDVPPQEVVLLPFWSPATFAGDSRAKGSKVLGISGLGFDLDQGQSEEEIRAILASSPYTWVLAASRNHMREKHGQVRARMRLVFPFSRPATDNDYRHTHAVLRLAWGLQDDPGARDPTRGWFACREVLAYHEGRLLDPLTPAEPKPTAGSDDEAIRNPMRHLQGALASAEAEVKGAPDGERNRVLNRNAYSLGRIAEACGISAEQIINFLVDLCIAHGDDPAKVLDTASRGVHDGMRNPRTVAAVIVPAVASQAAPDQQVISPILPAAEALRPCPPKPPGPPPADLTSVPGRRWTQMDNDYRAWQRDLRTILDARLVVVGYDQTRVLYVRRGLRRVEVLGTAHRQAGVIIQVAREGGLLVSAGRASEMAEEYLRIDEEKVVHARPSMWDRGQGLYLYESPKVEAGETPTWDTVLSRMSDAELFLAHVWATFEPKYRGRQVLWFQGAGNDGKTISVEAIFDGCGVPFASLSDSDLTGGNQFVFSSVWDKPAVLVGESKNVNILMTGMVHKLTGRDSVPVEYKHGQRFNAKFQGVVFVTSNNSPQIEKTRSNLSRLSVVTIEKGAWVTGLEGLLRAEMPALLARARDAYARRCTNDFDIDLGDPALAALDGATSFEEEQNATAFALTGLRIEGDDFLARTEVFKRLVAGGSKLADVNKVASFYRWLEQQEGVTPARLRGIRGYKGLKP